MVHSLISDDTFYALCNLIITLGMHVFYVTVFTVNSFIKQSNPRSDWY